MTTIFIIIGVVLFLVVLIVEFFSGTIIIIVDTIKKLFHKLSKSIRTTPTSSMTIELERHNAFKVISKNISKPFYAGNTNASHIIFIVLSALFVFISIGNFTTKNITLGIVFAVLGIGAVCNAVIIDKRFILQNGNCPYCGKLIQMGRRETRFDCSLCKRPVIKTETTIENTEPLNQSNQIEPIISFEEMRNNFFEKWTLSLQYNSEQRRRVERARADTVYMLFDINPDNGTAGCYSSNYDVTGKVYDVTYKRCTCQDFEKRELPCKHIYALNVNMDIIREDEDLSGIPSGVKEKMKLLPPENESYFWSCII